MLRQSPVYAFRPDGRKADAEIAPHLQSSMHRLATQAEAFDQALVTGLVALLDIVKQAAAGRYELEQATTGMGILDVILEVLGQVGNAFGQDGNLDFRRTSVVWLDCIFLDQGALALSSNRHRVYPFRYEDLGRLSRDVVQERP